MDTDSDGLDEQEASSTTKRDKQLATKSMEEKGEKPKNKGIYMCRLVISIVIISIHFILCRYRWWNNDGSVYVG